MPSALVATSALTRLASRSASAASRSSGSLLPVYDGDGVAPLAQELAPPPRRRRRERVDDAGAGQRVELRREPAQPLRGRRQLHDGQPQALAVQRAAQHQRARPEPPRPNCSVTSTHHPVVGRGGGGEHRDAGGQLGDQRAQPPVVGTEVVAPVGHAVGLVDDEHPGARREPGQHPVAEIGVVEPLGAHQQDVDLAGVDRGVGPLPLGGVGRVDRGGVDARPRRRRRSGCASAPAAARR